MALLFSCFPKIRVKNCDCLSWRSRCHSEIRTDESERSTPRELESSLARTEVKVFAIHLGRPPRTVWGINTHTTVFKMAAISCISGVALPARISARRSGKHPVALPGTARNRPASVSRFSTLSPAKSPELFGERPADRSVGRGGRARRGRGWLDLDRARGGLITASASRNARAASRRDRGARFPSASSSTCTPGLGAASIAPAHEARADHRRPSISPPQASRARPCACPAPSAAPCPCAP